MTVKTSWSYNQGIWDTTDTEDLHSLYNYHLRSLVENNEEVRFRLSLLSYPGNNESAEYLFKELEAIVGPFTSNNKSQYQKFKSRSLKSIKRWLEDHYYASD